MFITVTHNTTTTKESACRIICTGTSENGGMAGAESSPQGFQHGACHSKICQNSTDL